MKYRPDIDGLRALAVMPVVLFHAELPWLSGGYVGVDIFFVISGFLITSIILPEIQNGTFTIAGFYERRVRRIFPALFVVLAATLIVTFLVMLPDDFQNTTDSAVATLLFASNMFFYVDSGYFSGPAETKPLLHTWSLAVEEQFYIFWPWLLLLATRFLRFGLPTIVLVLALASLFIGEYQVRPFPDAAFYLLPSRAWELFAGAALAIGALPSPGNQWRAHSASLAGAGMILVAIFGYTPQTPFPGLSALLPCVGAGLIIWAGMEQETVVGRLLSIKPMVFVGLISYSLYLWHWPVFVLAKYMNRHELSSGAYAVLIVVAVALAALTWKFIETPLRRRKNGVPTPWLAGALGSVASVIIALGLYSMETGGIPGRLPAKALALADGKGDFGIRSDECLNRGLDRIKAGDLCRFGSLKNKSAIRFLLWGDSHAEAMAPAFVQLAAKNDAQGWYASRDACPPLLDTTQWPVKTNPKCPRFKKAMLEFIKQNDITDVVLVARWNLYAESWPKRGIESGQTKPFHVGDGSTTTPSVTENRHAMLRGLERTLAKLTRDGLRIWIVEQVPYVGFRVPEEYALSEIFPYSTPRAGPDPEQHRKRAAFIRRHLVRLQKKFPFRILDAARPLCTKGLCRVAQDGRALYRDDDHLSGHGARFIASALQPIFNR